MTLPWLLAAAILVSKWGDSVLSSRIKLSVITTGLVEDVSLVVPKQLLKFTS